MRDCKRGTVLCSTKRKNRPSRSVRAPSSVQVLLRIPKPVIPYPLVWEGAVRSVGSHLDRIPNYLEVPDTARPRGTALPGAPPRTPPLAEPPPPVPEPPPPSSPPPQGASGR